MLDESQLDEFLDEFFGEEKPASDAARLKNSGNKILSIEKKFLLKNWKNTPFRLTE